jgi:ketosteroid isomerase-like protein
MSQANVEIVRRIYDAAARRDDVAPFELYSEDIVWDLSNTRSAAIRSKPVYHGHEGVRQAWRDGLSAFADIRMELTELTDLDDDHVLAVVREQEVGRSSGAHVEARHFAVWTLAEGKVVRLQTFDDHDGALEAVRTRDDAPA